MVKSKIKIWGIVTNPRQQYLSNTSIQLLKKIKKHKRYYFIPVQKARTNDKGEYAFWVQDKELSCYKVIVLYEGEVNE